MTTAALTTIDVNREGWADGPRRKTVGRPIRQGLAQALADVAGIVDIRGQGLMIGIELDRPCGELVTTRPGSRLADQCDRRQGGASAAPLWCFSDAEGRELVERLSALIRAFLRPEGGAAMALVKHFLQFKDFTRAEFDYLFERTRWIKEQFKSYKQYWPLTDRTLVMIFEKASTRTRLSFEAGMHQLGGSAIYLNTRDSQLGRGEPVEDAAQVISRMSDVVMIRTFEQEIIERFAANSRVPVINGLTNEYHPCQIMADIFTFIEQRGPIQGKTVAWIGDSNNVCNTWLQAAEVLDFNVHVSTPPGYEVEAERAGLYGTDHFEQFSDPMEAAKGADLVTTDVWTSMGFEAENEERMRDFADWQVDADMMRVAKSGRRLHALPAGASRRGSFRRSDRRPAERGLGRGGEPAARTKSADGVSAPRPRQQLIFCRETR